MSLFLSVADKKRYARGVVLPLLIILVWEAGARLELFNVKILIPPSTVLKTTFTVIQSEDFWFDVQMSVSRMLLGFALGASAGLLVGFAMGLSRTIDRLLGLSFHAVRQIAVFAWIPL